ncbi:MAG: hypothetical protein ABR915_20980 [Thermoguttaceae bacterium]
MPRPKSKRLLKAEERFQAAVTTYIVSLGARPGMFYDYELDTPVGVLHISVYGDWVATRFADPARGTEFTKTCGHACNPYSGKWNFHFGDGTAASLAPETVLPQLDHFFDCLLHWEAVAA